MLPTTFGQTGYNIWAFSGYNVGESGVVASMYGVNPWKKFGVITSSGMPSSFTSATMTAAGHACGSVWAITMSVGSFHPGGANVGMADGSVRFLKETIASFPANALPATNYATNGPGPYFSGYNTYGMFPGTQMPVFNALSTRNGGEVISSDRILIESSVRVRPGLSPRLTHGGGIRRHAFFLARDRRNTRWSFLSSCHGQASTSGRPRGMYDRQSPPRTGDGIDRAMNP